MLIRIQRDGRVWTIIHSRFDEARNAMDPQSADMLVEAMLDFERDPGQARSAAEEIAGEIARFPQAAVRADRRSAIETYGLPIREAMRREWAKGLEAHYKQGAAGAGRFVEGRGRRGDFTVI